MGGNGKEGRTRLERGEDGEEKVGGKVQAGENPPSSVNFLIHHCIVHTLQY